MQHSSQYTPFKKLQQPSFLVLRHAQNNVRAMTVHKALTKKIMSNFFPKVEGCGQQYEHQQETVATTVRKKRNE
jgi:hypothetical protein